MEPSKDAQDTREKVTYKICYSPRETVSQVGAQGRPSGEFNTDNLEGAVMIYNQLRDPRSDLYREIRPDFSSVELYKVRTSETKMIDPARLKSLS